MLPIGGHARVCGRHAVGRINGDRNKKDDAEDIGHAEPKHAVAQEAPVPLADEARPHEQPGEQKQKRHQIDALPSAEQIEAEPAVAVHNRKGAPLVGRIVKAGRGRRNKLDVSQHRVEDQHDQNDDGPQVVECQAGARQGSRARHAGQKPISQLIQKLPAQSLEPAAAVASEKIGEKTETALGKPRNSRRPSGIWRR
jgi:hypothetical protein